ncbi:hypothetical protein GF324_11960 [bacterium]|nr:hypothetical protein [bacterium]
MKAFHTTTLILVIALLAGCGDNPKKRARELKPGETTAKTRDAGSKPDGQMPEGHGHGTMKVIARAGETIAVRDLRATLPDGWVQITPSSGMRAAEFVLQPAEDGVSPGTVSAFYFGPDAGGIQANLERWYNQFDQPDGTPTKEAATTEEFAVQGMGAILVHFTGTMKPSNMPGMGGGDPQTDWMNLSAILLTPEGPWFFKGTGPASTMQSHIDEMRAFVKSMQWAAETQS